MRMRPIVTVFLLLVAFGAGCSESPRDPEPLIAESAQPAFDLEVTMLALAATLDARAELLKRAVDDPDAVDRALADALSDTLYEERRLVQMIRVQIEDQPTWMPTICQWYDSALRAPSWPVEHEAMSGM